LFGDDVHREAVEDCIENSDLTVYLGHGLSDCLISDERLIDDKNIAKARGSFIVAVACQSAENLGRLAVERGVVAYLGFSDDLCWPDSFSDEFGRAATSGVNVLLRGGTLEQAAGKMKTEFASLMWTFRAFDHPDRPLALLSANWNMDYVCGRGDGQATLISRPFHAVPGLSR
jgi:hypothetical protein